MAKKKSSRKIVIGLSAVVLLFASLLMWNYSVAPFGKVKLSSYITHSPYCLAAGPQCGCPEGGQIVRNECYVDKATAERLIESY